MTIKEISGCCAVCEICYIANEMREGGGERTMKKFVDLACKSFAGYADYGSYRYYFSLPYRRFYIFTGVERNEANHDAYVGYASAFAAYIKQHRLGKVVKSDVESNHRIHPELFDQVFVWSPHHANLKKWVKKHVPDLPVVD